MAAGLIKNTFYVCTTLAHVSRYIGEYCSCEARVAFKLGHSFAMGIARTRPAPQQPEKSAPGEVIPPDPPDFTAFLVTSRARGTAEFLLLKLV